MPVPGDGPTASLFLGVSEDDQPVVSLMGADDHERLLLTIEDDCGTALLYAPGYTLCATLRAFPGGAGLIFDSPCATHHVSLVAHQNHAGLNLFRGATPGASSEACLAVSADGSISHLRRADGTVALQAATIKELTSLALRNTAGKDAIELSHHHGNLNRLVIHTPAGLPAINAGATREIARLALTSPLQPGYSIETTATGPSLTSVFLHDLRPLIALTHGESGGSIATYGTGENPGFAALSGQKTTASLTVSSSDGTTLAGLGATDHGGQLTLNNDLGFPRISMGIHSESSGISLNHTGQKGLSLLAGPNGGLLIAHDPEGQPRATLPEDYDDSEPAFDP